MEIKCSKVIDISSKKNNFSDGQYFFLDTNIWKWLTYVGSNENDFNGMYSSFIHDIYKSKNAKLVRSKLTYGELTHIIEREVFKESSHKNIKQFRNNNAIRSSVIDNIKASINQMENMIDKDVIIKENLNEINKTEFFDYLESSRLDGTDILMAIAIKNNGIINVVSDDQDFASIQNVELYTLNKRVIEQAKRMNKLVSK